MFPARAHAACLASARVQAGAMLFTSTGQSVGEGEVDVHAAAPSAVASAPPLAPDPPVHATSRRVTPRTDWERMSLEG